MAQHLKACKGFLIWFQAHASGYPLFWPPQAPVHITLPPHIHVIKKNQLFHRIPMLEKRSQSKNRLRVVFGGCSGVFPAGISPGRWGMAGRGCMNSAC